MNTAAKIGSRHNISKHEGEILRFFVLNLTKYGQRDGAVWHEMTIFAPYIETRTSVMTTSELIRARLDALRDESYAAFQRRLIPTLAADRIVGVRTPQLRALAKELAAAEGIGPWMEQLPHPLFEEQQLHTFLIGSERDFGRALALTQRFLPHVDNWATCDQLSPRAFRGRLDALEGPIDVWLRSEHEYTVRFAVGMLMAHGLDGAAFRPEHIAQVAALRRPEYYIRMMQAWYLATALAKQWDATLPVLTERRLADPWTHHKTIQKAVESYRITDERKALLRTLRRMA